MRRVCSSEAYFTRKYMPRSALYHVVARPPVLLWSPYVECPVFAAGNGSVTQLVTCFRWLLVCLSCENTQYAQQWLVIRVAHRQSVHVLMTLVRYAATILRFTWHMRIMVRHCYHEQLPKLFVVLLNWQHRGRRLMGGTHSECEWSSSIIMWSACRAPLECLVLRRSTWTIMAPRSWYRVYGSGYHTSRRGAC